MTASGNDSRFALPEPGSRSATLYAVAATVVALNSALYFFGVESLSHPAVSALGLALVIPLYFGET